VSATDVSAAWQAYQRLRLQLNGRISRELSRSTGLSEADFDILCFLEESPDGSVRSMALRCGLEWEKSRLSHQLRRMEGRGLITKSAGAVVQLTEQGRTQVAAARACHDAAVRRYFGDVLTADQLAALTTISDQVMGRLSADSAEPPHQRHG
jgi:DNA-binding MarR family transcriptional regulator